MANLLATPFQAFDNNGDPASLAKLFTYVAGSVATDKATYSDRALTSQRTNPVVADSAGRFGPVYGTDEEGYKLVLKSSDELTTYWTIDNFYGDLMTDEVIATRIKQIASNPLDYGAVGDGVANERSYVQSAIDNATGVIDLLGKTFRCDTALTITSNKTITNGTLDFSNSTDNDTIQATGTIGSSVVLASDVTAGDRTISVDSASGLAVGDFLALEDGQAYTDSVSFHRGEIVEIDGISGTTLTLRRPAQDGYTVASGGNIRKITPVTDVTFRNLRLIGPGLVSGAKNLVTLKNVVRTRIFDCDFKNADSAALRILGGFDTIVDGCSFRNNGAQAIEIGNASTETVVRDCQVSGFSTSGIATTNSQVSGITHGPVRDLDIVGCRVKSAVDATMDGIFIAEMAENVRIAENRIDMAFSSGTPNCINVECVNVEIKDNTLYSSGAATTVGVDLGPNCPNRTGRSYSVVVEGNRFRVVGTGITYAPSTTLAAEGVLDQLIIRDNTFGGSATTSISVAAGTDTNFPDLSFVEISNNVCAGAISVTTGHAGIPITTALVKNNKATQIVATGTSTAFSNLQMEGNYVAGSIAKLIDIDTIVRVIATDNNLVGDGSNSHGFEITNCTSVQTNGGSIVSVDGTGGAVYIKEGVRIGIRGMRIDVDNRGIFIDNDSTAFSSCVINGCNVTGANTGTDGVLIDVELECRGLVIAGNYMESATNGNSVLSIEGTYTGILISSNTIGETAYGALTTQLVNFAGAGANAISNVFTVGNVFFAGATAIAASSVRAATYKGFANVYFPTITTYSELAVGGGLIANAYDVTNLTTDRTYDAPTAAVAETNNVLGTLLQDLERIGLLTET